MSLPDLSRPRENGPPVRAVRPGSELREHLLQAAIAGDVDTPREVNLRNAGLMARRRPGFDFGIPNLRDWTQREVLEVMVRRCGVQPDPAYTRGPDTIDVDLTLAALQRFRDRLTLAARRRERVLLATGHPTGIMVLHLAVAGALREAGATVLVPPMSWQWPWGPEVEPDRRPRHVRAVAGVHVLACGGDLLHTHSPEPGRALLQALDRSDEALPDLVFADHGWAGVAATAGVETLGFADSNDPALFVGQEEGLPLDVVPLDDNVLPHLYDPVADFLVAGLL